VKKRGSLAALTTVVTVAVGVGLAGFAWALWKDSDSFTGGEITTGDMRLDLVGTPVWERIVDDEATAFIGVAMPGEQVRVTTTVRSYLRGDNLAGGFDASFEREIGDAVAAEINIHVENASGVIVAGPAPLGGVLAVPGLVGSNDGITAEWRIVVHVVVESEINWVPNLEPPFDDHEHWPGGNLHLTLSQVRSGPGFS